MANIIDKKINPEIPIVQESNRNEVYLPQASYTNTGTAGFYKTHFIVDDNGIVHLRKAPERAISAITYDSNTNTLIITFDDETVETIKLNDCGCVDGTDILVYDAFKIINFKETSWYDASTNKVLIISAAETGYDNDELVCQLDKYNVISTNVNDSVIASNYQSNYEYQIYKCTDGSIAIFANTAFAGRFIILKREFAVQKNVANITYDDVIDVLTIYYVTGDKKNVLIDRTITDVDFPSGDFTDVQYNTTDGIKLEGSAKAKYKGNAENDVSISFDVPLIPADDTVSIDRAEAAETKKVLIKATKGIKSISKTANGGLECTLSDNTKLQTDPFVTIAQEEGNSKEQVMSQKAVTDALAKKPTGGIGVEIGVESPSSTTQGILTQIQLETLQANEDNYVMFQHEKYYLNDKGHTEGYLTYTHTGYENNTYWIKSITITISTLTWVLNKGGFAGNGLEFDSTDKLQAKLGTGLSFGMNGEINAEDGSLDVDTLYALLTSNASNISITKSNDKVKIAIPDKAVVQNLENTEYFYLDEVYSPDGSSEQPSTDVTNSVIISNSHMHDIIFRFIYGNIQDVKLSELARRSEIPSGGTYYRHLIRLYNTSTFNDANNVVYFELISTSMVAIDSLTDLYTYAKGVHSATGFIGSTGNTYGPVISVQVTTNAGRVYYAEASTNFSRQMYDTLADYGLTYVGDTVANL